MSDQPEEVVVTSQSTPARTVGGAMGARSRYDVGPPPSEFSQAFTTGQGVVSRQESGATFLEAPSTEISWRGERR